MSFLVLLGPCHITPRYAESICRSVLADAYRCQYCGSRRFAEADARHWAACCKRFASAIIRQTGFYTGKRSRVLFGACSVRQQHEFSSSVFLCNCSRNYCLDRRADELRRSTTRSRSSLSHVFLPWMECHLHHPNSVFSDGSYSSNAL